MQPLGAVTLDDLMGRGQEILEKFEVYDGATWVDLCSIPTGSNSALAGWPYRKRIDIQTAYLDANLTDFPLYVRINADANIGAACRADGFDIRFTAADGATLLKYERESFAVAGGLASGDFWVKTNLAMAGTYIWLYYGNPDAADGGDPENVWDADFKAVYHMKDATTSTILDSTANNNDGAKKAANEPIEVDGKIGKGQNFDGANDYIRIANNASINGLFDNYTVSGWFYADSAKTGNYRIFVEFGDPSGYKANSFLDDSATATVAFNFTNEDGTSQIAYKTLISADAWHYIVARYNSADAKGYLTIDGVAGISVDITKKLSTQLGTYFGIRQAASLPFDGVMDELRFATTARSAAWIKFEYRNMAEADNELTWGAEEDIRRSHLKSLSFSLGGAGVSPEPIAGEWEAEIQNDDGMFHPKHPTSAYTSLLQVGRKVRLSVGARYGGTAYYWPRLVGYMGAPTFRQSSSSVALRGMDSMKLMTDKKLCRPDNYWGTSVAFSSVETAKTFGANIYMEYDALDPDTDGDEVPSWTPQYATFASVADATLGSAYVGELSKDNTHDYGRTGDGNIGSVTQGKVYEAQLTYKKVSGTGTASCFLFAPGTADIMAQVNGLEAAAPTTVKFHFTASKTGTVPLYFYIYGTVGTTAVFRFDQFSLREVTARSNTRYPMPTGCNGPYYATLDGVPSWIGDTNRGSDVTAWFYDEANKVFYLDDEAWIETGTNNLVVYYFTTQTVENVVADLLVAANLYATQGAALAAMDYTATGVTVPRVWFDSGDSTLEGARLLAERVNYRFWFDALDVPHFLPAPTLGGVMAAFTDRTTADDEDFQDLEEIRNRVSIEGIEQGMYAMREDKPKSRLVGTAFDATSIAVYKERTFTATNHLFQDQASIDAAAATMLAAFKDPKLYAAIRIPLNAAPLELGDTIGWPIVFRPGGGDIPDTLYGGDFGETLADTEYGGDFGEVLADTLSGGMFGESGISVAVTGIIRDIAYAGREFTYKLEIQP